MKDEKEAKQCTSCLKKAISMIYEKNREIKNAHSLPDGQSFPSASFLCSARRTFFPHIFLSAAPDHLLCVLPIYDLNLCAIGSSEYRGFGYFLAHDDLIEVQAFVAALHNEGTVMAFPK